ncbi:MAG: hypothetical protein CMB80_08835 [Flammeovirgaceae bacterium]|nr:hypothetical protein [Flammeovirgaceae bacterium]|tara:strand:+ start:3954 stop:4670 length:717 start_codon:yes stop_codon:yes gene_type:complete
MAYNILSGTVIAAQEYIPGDLIVGNIVSGNLSTSDASAVINVPRISNATNNALVTNVGGDANDLTCETNLAFDGSTLDITGDLTASVGISAPYYWGDGSNLTGIGAGSVSGSARHYSATGLETSGYLKVSGSAIMVGGIVMKRKVVADDYEIQEFDYFIGIRSNTLASSITLTLPTAAGLLSGQMYVVKDEGGAIDSYPVTITCSAADTIDGQNEVLLESPYASVQIYCNGVGKYFIY